MSELADQDQTITTPSFLFDSTNMSNQDTPHEKSTEPKTPTAKTLLPLILNCYNYNVDNLNSPDDMVSCKECSKNITYKLGDPTSNLSRHIKNSNSLILKHEELLKEICQKPSPVRSAKQKLSEIEPNPIFSPLKSIKNFEEYRPSDPKKIRLDLKLCHLIVSKSLPITLVDAKEFRDYSNKLDPRYKPPNSQTLKSSILPKSKIELREFLIKEFVKIDSLNVVTDIWTDLSMRSFIGFEVTGINPKWERVKFNICSKQLKGSHNNERIFNTFIDVVNEYKIGEKIFKIVSNGASNMVKAFNKEHIDEYIENFLELCETSETYQFLIDNLFRKY